MTKLIILGSSNAVPSLENENTHLLVLGDQYKILVDCPSNPLLRLETLGINFNEITDLILTHFHPDHVAGLPQFLMSMWLLGRLAPLAIYGLKHTIDRAEAMMDLFCWSEWRNFFPVHFHRLPEDEMFPFLENAEMHVFSSPVKHFVPTIGLRFEFAGKNRIFSYSSDTAACNAILPLAENADLLLHEASGASSGHSSAAQAGEVAHSARAKELLLIHYPSGKYAQDDLVAQAAQTFSGPVRLATDFMEYDF